MVKTLTILIIAFTVYLGSQITGIADELTTYLTPEKTQAVEETKTYDRTVETVKWTETICSNKVTKKDHTMVLISKEEIIEAVNKAGFTGNSAKIMVALATAEGQNDLACVGDETLTDSKWGISIGLWQIRTLHSEKNTGACRDAMKLATGGIQFQADCAFQISARGTTFSPWSAYTNGKYKKYM